ncbi:Sugar transporter [Popillia japonica]|uniref:Sugar transporter n=1 Tax=Popillia japonica TaxID=7064 RepID=A0AAW1LT61_POPJA
MSEGVVIASDNSDAKVKKKSYSDWKQIRAIFAANLAAFGGSVLFNWPSPSIPKLLSGDYPDITEEDVSYLPVIPPIVTVLTSPSFGFFLRKFGRKYTLLSIAGFHLISFILLATAKTKWEFYLSRVFFGISDIFMFGTLPVYVAEISTPKVRGTWGGAMMIFVFFAQFFVNTLGYYCDIPTTAWILTIVPIIFFISFVFMPESPYHYLLKGNREEARKSLLRLRDSREDINSELDRIEADIRRQILDSAKFKHLVTVKSNRSAFIIVFMTITIQQFSGCPSFNVYNQLIFQQAGQNLNRGYASMICSIVLAIATLCGPIFVEKVGRRLSIVISTLGCGLVLLALAAYFVVKDETSLDTTFVNWFPLAGLLAYFISFAIGLSVVPFMLQGELFATNMRGHAAAAMNITICLSISVSSKLFHYLMTSFGLYVPFTFFAICSFLGMLYCYKFVPETRGKTLEEIQQLMKQNV